MASLICFLRWNDCSTDLWCFWQTKGLGKLRAFASMNTCVISGSKLKISLFRCKCWILFYLWGHPETGWWWVNQDFVHHFCFLSWNLHMLDDTSEYHELTSWPRKQHLANFHAFSMHLSWTPTIHPSDFSIQLQYRSRQDLRISFTD